jgi:hypothetical protein
VSTEPNSPYHNETPQVERRAVLINEQAQGTTYLARAATSLEAGGRFAGLAERQVVGTGGPIYPAQPPNSFWSRDVVPNEPPLGIDVNRVE